VTRGVRALGVVLVAAGLLATGLNLYGLTAGIRQPTLPRPPLTAAQRALLREPIDQRRGEPDARYFRRLTETVHLRIGHTPFKYVVPAHENWIINISRLVVPSNRDYEFQDYHRAFERGAGICTQYSAAVFDVLKRQGFDRSIALFPVHTLVEARTRGGKPFLLDADNGVVVPYALAAVRAHPALVAPYYRRADVATTSHPERSPARLARVVQRAFGGRILSVQRTNATPHRAEFERVAYLLKWPLPLLSVVAGALLLVVPGRRAGASLVGAGSPRSASSLR
jgi:hypothetical protein